MYHSFLLVVFFLITLNLIAQTEQSNKSLTDTVNRIIDSTQLYGFIEQRPIKVGGGPKEQRNYLDRLRDAQGNKVSYKRLYSCCPYNTDSPNAMFGGGMLDVYEITYQDSDNKKQKVQVYITFYDFETPRAIKGFSLTD